MNKIEFLYNRDKYKGVDSTPFLQHYGILGQKWGQRRWQNADGTFNEEGKQRYFGKKNSSDSSDEDKVGGMKSDVKDYLKFRNKMLKQRTRDDLNKWYRENNKASDKQMLKDAKKVDKQREKMYKNQLKDFYDDPNELVSDLDRIYKIGGQEGSKSSEDNKIKQLLDNARVNVKPTKELKGKDISDEELQDIINNVDNTEGWQDWNKLKKNNKEEFDNIADLGLDAAGRSSKYWDPSDDIGDDDWREWFIYEDQTIGLPQLAKLYYDGYSKDYINKMIDKVSSMSSKEYEDKYGEDSATKFFIDYTNYQNQNKEFVNALFDPDYDVKNQKIGSIKSNIPKKVYEANKNDPQSLKLLEDYYKNHGEEKEKDSNTKKMDKFYSEKEDNYLLLNQARKNLGLNSKKELTQADWDRINAEINRLKK